MHAYTSITVYLTPQSPRRPNPAKTLKAYVIHEPSKLQQYHLSTAIYKLPSLSWYGPKAKYTQKKRSTNKMSSAAAAAGEGKVVCVTGASGYIASWLVKLLLERGYTVKASVRDLSKLNLLISNLCL